MPPLPIKLPLKLRLPTKTCSLLAAKMIIPSWQSQAGSLTVEFDPLGQPNSDNPFHLGLVWGNHLSCLGMESLSIIGRHPRVLGMDPQRLDPSLRLVLLDSILEPMIDDLSLFLGEEVYFKLFENDNIPSDLGQSLKFRISLNGLDSKFTTALTIWPGSDKAWQILHEKLLGLSDLKNLDLRALTVPMRITIGGQKISINDLNCLLPGDLLLSVPDIDPNVLYLEYPEQAWASMIVKDGQSTLTQALLKEMDVVDNNMPDEVTSAGNSMVNLLACPGIKAIELPIRFEVGQKTMTLGQIEGLNVGSVIDFATNGLQVNVTCHGQTLAYGQLIDMEGIVGVQITKLNSLALTPNSSRE